MKKHSDINRRDFVKGSSAALAGVALGAWPRTSLGTSWSPNWMISTGQNRPVEIIQLVDSHIKNRDGRVTPIAFDSPIWEQEARQAGQQYRSPTKDHEYD